MAACGLVAWIFGREKDQQKDALAIASARVNSNSTERERERDTQTDPNPSLASFGKNDAIWYVLT